MKKLNIEDFNDLVQPTTITFLDTSGKTLRVHVYESEIYIDTDENSWCLVGESKKQFEQIINPETGIKKHIKSHIKNFLISLSKLF